MLKPLNLSAETPAPTPKKFPATILMMFVLALAGALSGWGLFKFKAGPGVKKLKTEVTGTAQKGESYGVEDTEVFTDSAEGELVNGGIDGEGSHHLTREGGESQNVYLTSSIIDLDQFVGRQVKVWGQTFEAQKAGWLMDVGRLEIVK